MMGIDIEGEGYKGKIIDIVPSFSNQWSFAVRIEFEEPYPENIISTSVHIPTTRYSKDELIRIVKIELEKMLEQEHNRRQRIEEQNRKEREMEEFAVRVKQEVGLF